MGNQCVGGLLSMWFGRYSALGTYQARDTFQRNMTTLSRDTSAWQTCPYRYSLCRRRHHQSPSNLANRNQQRGEMWSVSERVCVKQQRNTQQQRNSPRNRGKSGTEQTNKNHASQERIFRIFTRIFDLLFCLFAPHLYARNRSTTDCCCSDVMM
jgi:hypothetical protein